MIKRILAAVDGSPASLAALRQAAAWAAQLDARLSALYVIDEQRFVYYPAATSFEGGVVLAVPLPDDKRAEVEAKVKEEERQIRADFDRVAGARKGQAEFRAERGDVNTILVREARASDLVVLGKRGRFDSPASRQAGPTTETLIHEALRPVLVVPEASRTEGGILIAYDNSKGVQRILPTALHMAGKSRSGVALLTVDDKPERAQELQAPMRPYLQAHGIEAKFMIEKGKPAEAIVKAAQAANAGLIVMGAFNRNPVYELFFGSTTLRVLEHAPCPVLLTA
jgi:nucleotide-binding universal stress UspA family protein